MPTRLKPDSLARSFRFWAENISIHVPNSSQEVGPEERDFLVAAIGVICFVEANESAAHAGIEFAGGNIRILRFDHDRPHIHVARVLQCTMPQPPSQSPAAVVLVNHQVPNENSIVPVLQPNVEQRYEPTFVLGYLLVGEVRIRKPRANFCLRLLVEVIAAFVVEGNRQPLLDQMPAVHLTQALHRQNTLRAIVGADSGQIGNVFFTQWAKRDHRGFQRDLYTLYTVWLCTTC